MLVLGRVRAGRTRACAAVDVDGTQRVVGVRVCRGRLESVSVAAAGRNGEIGVFADVTGSGRNGHGRRGRNRLCRHGESRAGRPAATVTLEGTVAIDM